MILATHGIVGSSIGQIDADALAFFARVTAAGGTLSATEQNAVNQLVLDMKNDGIWTKMKAIYPMVGASAAACAQNLKSSSFTGTFTSGWTFASTGAKPNGTSAYMDTGLNANSNLTFDTTHISYYSRTQSATSASTTFGVSDGTFTNQFRIILRRTSDAAFFISSDSVNGVLTYTITNSQGFFIGNSNGTNIRKFIRNNSILTPNTNSAIGTGILPSFNFYLGCVNAANAASQFDDKECAFASVGDGLTDTEASNLYTAVQAFQTTLNRQV